MWPPIDARTAHDKQAIGQAFSRAAQTYDAHAALQRCVGDRVNQLLSESSQPVTHLLDVGCGTGYIARHWHHAGAEVTALDLSEAMLAKARSADSAQIYVRGDAEQLPFADQQFDFCSSNLALQWCADLRMPLKEMYRILAPKGQCVFTTLISGSLRELVEAWAQVDDYQHVNECLTLPQLETLLSQVGADQYEYDVVTHTMWYPSVLAMMKDLKGIGATHVHGERRQGLLGRGQLEALEAALRPLQNEQGLLPLSYVVFYGVLKRD